MQHFLKTPCRLILFLIIAGSSRGDWTLKNPAPLLTRYEDICFIDALTGWIAAQSGDIVHTKDGGATWTVQKTNAYAGLSAVYFLDPDHGWAAGSGGHIYSTDDGGQHWHRQDTPLSTHLFDIFFIDTDRGWAVDGWIGCRVSRG